MMAKFYDQPKHERDQLVADMSKRIHQGLMTGIHNDLHLYAASSDTHLRKWAYTILGRIYKEEAGVRKRILSALRRMLDDQKERVRQTALYAAGQIGDMRIVSDILERGLKDSHHSVRNGVIGALKLIGSKDPKPVLAFARKHMTNDDPEVRRQVIHGIELRGRTHPREVLPLLRQMQDERSGRVRKMIVHVLGQISYKKGCLETVIAELKTWNNDALVRDAVNSILSVHREQTYCEYSYQEAKEYISKMLAAW